MLSESEPIKKLRIHVLHKLGTCEIPTDDLPFAGLLTTTQEPTTPAPLAEEADGNNSGAQQEVREVDNDTSHQQHFKRRLHRPNGTKLSNDEVGCPLLPNKW